MFSLLETRPRHINVSELNQMLNVARPDLQQRETDSTPFVISKTNNPDVKRESASGGRVSTDVIWQQITQ